MKLIKNRSGLGLIVMVTLIAIGGIVITISTRVFENMARQTQLRVDQTKAHYLAQAGVMRAVWNWYTANTTTEGSRRWSPINTTVTGNNLFRAGRDFNASYLQSNYAYVAPISHTGIAIAATIGTAQQKNVGTQLVRTLTVGVTQGDLIVVTFAMDDVAGNVTVVDSGVNTYSIAADVTNAGNVRTMIFYAIAETALVATNTITVTHPAFAGPTVTARAMSARSFTGANHLDIVATATGSALTATTTGMDDNHTHALIIGAIGAEGPGGDTFTPGASFTTMTDIGTTGGAGDSNATIDPEYRVVNAKASYVANGTICTAAQSAAGRDYAVAMAVFYGRAHWYSVPATANRRLRAWRLQNIHNASSIVLTDMKVSWTGGGAARVNDIFLNNVSVIPAGGPFTTGTTINVTDTTLTTGSSWSGINTSIQWDNSGPTDPTTVTVQFIFQAVGPATAANSDVNSHEVKLWDGTHASGIPNQRTFKVTSTGQVNQTLGNYFKVLKTVNATVSGSPGLTSMEIVDWDEGEKNIP